MEKRQHLLVLLLLPLLPVVLLAVATDPVVAKNYKFRQDPVCPPAVGVPASMTVEGVQSPRTCSIECSVRTDCAVYSFVSASNQCQMGSTADLLNTWSTSPGTPCVSQLNPRLPGILTFRSKLLAFLDFRVGQDNLVGSAQFKVQSTSSGVTFVPGQGAMFAPLSSGVSNYIELQNSGGLHTIASLLGRGNNFSVYARINRLVDVEEQWIYLLSDCESYNQPRGAMLNFQNRTGIFHSMTSPDEIKFRISADMMPQPPVGVTNVETSMGVVFSDNDFTGTFYNGTLYNVQPFSQSGLPNFTGLPECIRLGYSPEPNKGLVGRFTCFVIANATLTASEFAELDALCW